MSLLRKKLLEYENFVNNNINFLLRDINIWTCLHFTSNNLILQKNSKEDSFIGVMDYLQYYEKL